MTSAATKGFRKLCFSTLVAVYFLIFVGGVVRSTGSGMGCPDWPKCFGNWTPPTSINQLPSNYKEEYSAIREKKNQKFARYLRLLGMNVTADKILNDKSILIESDFNPTKTWIEYINRLVGVVIGILITFLFYKSLPFRKEKPVLFWVSLITFLSVIVQGWFGSIVVSTNLTTWTITVHMFLALIIVGMLVFLFEISNETTHAESFPSRWLLVLAIGVLVIQTFLGTEVRSAIDILVNSMERKEWIDSLGGEFIRHRSFSWIVFFTNAIILWQTQKTNALKTLSGGAFVLILCSLASGVGMVFFNVPPFLQPLHLVLATMAIGIELMMFFRIHKSVTN